MNIQMQNNNRISSTIKHSLGYLPAVLLKAIIEDDINLLNNEKTPITFSINTCCLYIDITKLFENSSSNLNKNEASNSTNFNYTKNLYIPEYYYFFFNRFQEKLISIITNHGGDIIFEGTGVYAIWPPEHAEDEEENREKIINIYLRTIQCALDLLKKALKSDFTNKALFFPKIGISYGLCKFIIFKTEYGKYEYSVYGDALIDSFDCSTKVTKKGQIITNRKLLEDISKYIDYNFIDEENKYLSIKSLKNTGNILQNNKSTVNLIRNNFTLEQILNKKEILTNFSTHLISNTPQNSLLDEKWHKEIRYMTLLFVRIKMTKNDYEATEQIHKNFRIIHKIVVKYGGIINKILTDKDGFIYLISIGIKKYKDSENEIRGVLAAFEICKKLKRKKIIPYIGIATGFSYYGLIGTLGGRREVFIISGLLFFGLLSMEKSKEINENKKDKYEDDNILLDENTMNMIDHKIPCRFWKKLPTILGIDINLFTPQKIESLLNEHYVSNLFPLIGTHLHEKEGSSYEKIYELSKEDNIIFLEEELLRNIVKIINDFTLNRTSIKIINITSISGCGKTLLLKKCLDTYFEANPKLKDTLINNKSIKEYPFVFNANLTFTIDSDILINYNTKNDYRGLQLILKTMYDNVIKDNEGKKKIKKFFNQNKDIENYLKKIIIFDNSDNQIEENYNDFNSFKEDSFILTKENYKKIHQLFIIIIKEYKKIINNIYRDILYETNIYMPLIIIIDDINICDDLTIEFIKFYLSNEGNDFLLITSNSIPIYPPYVYLEKKQRDPFYDIKNKKSIAKFKIESLDTDEKKITFIKSVLKEIKGINISSISRNILKFFGNKTFGGIQFFVMRLIMIIVEQNYFKIENEKLIENEALAKMMKYNDYSDFILSRIFQKKIGEIISNVLDDEDICLLKIASLFGDLFELSQLRQVILIDNSSVFLYYLKKGEDQYMYEKLKDLESKYIIEIIEDLDLKHKYVICKFSIPFLREILYQRIPSEQRNQLHYIIGKMTKINFHSKYGNRNKYLSNEDELEMLKNHLKFSEITIHENFLKGTISQSEILNDNLNINNLKTLLTQQICSKISLIKVNDDINNMVKAGYIYKKSDGKLTWEYRYFVLTTNRVVYYYNEEDYKKEEIPPLGIFYLQNLFSVNLLTDGYVGGKKNIFSLSVNEWIKKGNYMRPRIYYLSIEDREELYKWIITFNILKIKAFYDNYSQNFGYVNFPLYKRHKNENTFKPKKNTKFNFELYKEIYLKINGEKLKKTKRKKENNFVFNKYFLRDENNSKNEDDIKNISLIQGMLIKFKFLVKFTLPIFLSNIQLSLKKSKNDFNKLVSESPLQLEFKTPSYVESLKENKINKEIEIIDELIKNNNKKQSEKRVIFTTQEKKYFSQFYPNIIRPKENKIYFKIKNIKKYIVGKPFEKKKYKLLGNDNKKVDLKSEWNKYFEEEQNFFKNCQEEKIDTTDNLRYTDFIEKYDLSGNLKERQSIMFRQSISSKINGQNKNTNESPILNNLMKRYSSGINDDDFKENLAFADNEDDKNNNDKFEKNQNLDDDLYENIEDDNEINNDKENDKKDNEDEYNVKESEESKKKKSKEEKSKNSENTKQKKSKDKKNKSKKKKTKEKQSEDTVDKKEKLNKNKKNKKNSNLIELVSDKNKNKEIKAINREETKLKSNNFDFAKAIQIERDISNKNIGKNIIISKSSSEKNEKVEGNLNMNKGSINSLFSFGENKNKIPEVNKNSQNNKANDGTNSFNYQDSSMVKSSKSSENESNKFINSNINSKNSNEEESFYEEKENNTNNQNELLSLKNNSKEALNKNNERKISFNSNSNSNNNIKNSDSNNFNSNNTEKFSEYNENNKINENKNNNIASRKSTASEKKQKSSTKYDYLNGLSPNRKFIINLKLNNQNKEKNKTEKKNNNESAEIKSIKNSEIDVFDKLRDLNFSLDNEKSLSSYFKRIKIENAIKKEVKEMGRNKNGNSTKYSEMTIQSTNSNYDNLFYPNAYYISEDNHLHSKTHVSMFFTNLKNQNNIYNQEENN